MRNHDCQQYNYCLTVAAKKDATMPCNTGGCPRMKKVIERPKPIMYPVADVKRVRDNLVRKREELIEQINLLDRYLEAVS
jgi:hypothetical protein